jgi:uncharacterized protein YlxW (UPF0749 family)
VLFLKKIERGIYMKRIKSQLSLGLVCIVLGLMLSFQLKSTFNTLNVSKSRQFKDLTTEIDSLKKQRDDVLVKLQEFQNKVDSYEKNAASKSETAKVMKDEIDKLRFLSGVVDVQGEGITINITPVTDIKSGETSPISSSDIIDIVNELNSVGAEAISINEERYVGRTQIRDIGSYIKINDSKFSMTQAFTICAIGAPDILHGVFNLPGSIVEDLKNAGFQVDIQPSTSIKILKYNKSLDYKYMKTVGR